MVFFSQNTNQSLLNMRTKKNENKYFKKNYFIYSIEQLKDKVFCYILIY